MRASRRQKVSMCELPSRTWYREPKIHGPFDDDFLDRVPQMIERQTPFLQYLLSVRRSELPKTEKRTSAGELPMRTHYAGGTVAYELL